MGANAATQAYSLIRNVERVLAIELMNASQAMAFRAPFKSSEFIEIFLKKYRKEVPFVKQDEILHDDIEKSIRFVRNYDVAIEELFLNDYGVKMSLNK
jgi:histidine ammonia-lyase